MSVAGRTGAITELERAVRYDPNFALAQAALASAYTQRFFYDSTDKETEQRAFVAIQKALLLNADLGEAYLARAQLTWNLSNGFPHERAVVDLRKALQFNPNLAEAPYGKLVTVRGTTWSAVAASPMLLTTWSIVPEDSEIVKMLCSFTPPFGGAWNTAATRPPIALRRQGWRLRGGAELTGMVISSPWSR